MLVSLYCLSMFQGYIASITRCIDQFRADHLDGLLSEYRCQTRYHTYLTDLGEGLLSEYRCQTRFHTYRTFLCADSILSSLL